MKTKELTGAALNWAVAKCEIPNDVRDDSPRFWLHPNNPKLVCAHTYDYRTYPEGYKLYTPSLDWAQGGPIIERNGIGFWKSADDNYRGQWAAAPAQWMEVDIDSPEFDSLAVIHGPTPLIAAMRCYVVSKLGDEIKLPAALGGN